MTRKCDNHNDREAVYHYKNSHYCDTCWKTGRDKYFHETFTPYSSKKVHFTSSEIITSTPSKLRDETRIRFYEQNPSEVLTYFVNLDYLARKEVKK